MRWEFRVALLGALVLSMPVGSAAEDVVPDRAIQAIDAFIAEQKTDKSDEQWKQHLNRPPKQRFDPNRTYYWVMNTNKGVMKFRLMPKVAPMHVTSTIYLTNLGFYDDVVFHRVIQDFMAQGGDPTGTGSGDPGYEYGGEFRSNVRHDKRGLLSMANAGPGTDGSQFFITFVPTPHLDGKHTIFGEIVEGMDTLNKIEAAGRHPNAPSHTPKEPLFIRKATIQVE